MSDSSNFFSFQFSLLIFLIGYWNFLIDKDAISVANWVKNVNCHFHVCVCSCMYSESIHMCPHACPALVVVK